MMTGAKRTREPEAEKKGTDHGAASKSTLYYEAPSTDSAYAHRMMLITYSFPPDRLVGGLRWQEMSRHFAERGWAVDVVTRDFTNVPNLDLARLRRLAPGTRVFSVPDREPLIGRAQRLAMTAVRAISARRNHGKAVRDASTDATSQSVLAPIRKAILVWLSIRRSASWTHAAARIAIDLTKHRRYTAVISSGPPHMAHEAGRQVAVSAAVPLVVDMRDPWSLVERLPDDVASPLWYAIARRHERAVVHRAALVTMNTEKACHAMRVAYPELANRIEVIRNGSDDSAVGSVKRDSIFRIRFAGSIYLDRDPRLVFRAAARVIEEVRLTPERFVIEFVGDEDHQARKPAAAIAAEEGIEEFVRIGGVLSREATLEFLAAATMLLSLPQDSALAIPAKIYEYVAVDAWMLVLAHRNSATAQLLEGSDADVVDPADVDGMVAAIRRRVDQFSSGVTPTAVGKDGRFDRRIQSDKLMRLIDGCSKDTRA
jgi:glycosyltransferase involved in cell wall biosynthesis